MNKSETIGELAKALSKAQGEMTPAKKDSNNPFFKSKYADLASVWNVCRKPLADNGLSVTQLTHREVDGIIILETVLLHASGEWLSSDMPVIPIKQDPQGQGSALTYARRYALSAILGIAADEDDDGEGAGRVEEKKTPPEPAPSLTPQQLYETALTQKTGVDLCAFAMKHGWTKESLQTTLGIKKSAEIVDVGVAAKVLFPEPKSSFIEEAEKLGAVKEKGG